MTAIEILLIVLSGLGTIHGLFLAVFIWGYQKGHRLSNRLLSLLLLILAFRIGKSVMLEFSDGISIELVFIGLGSMLAIGPLFFMFTVSCCDKTFRYSLKNSLHFLPAVVGIVFGFWLNEERFSNIPELYFALLFLGYYLQYLLYLMASFLYLKKKKKDVEPSTEKFIKLLAYSLFAIWGVYFLNVIDDTVPYIFGPILYSLVVYTVSYIVIKNQYLKEVHYEKYQSTTSSGEKTDQLYNRLVALMEDEHLYTDPSISLKTLSKSLNVTPQVLSMTINSITDQNFNAFINTYRVKEAAKWIENSTYNNHSLSAIAYEVGFNSISSFNINFKKVFGITPSSYRKTKTK